MWFVERIHGMGNDNCKTGLFCNGLLPPLSIAHSRKFGVGLGSWGGGDFKTGFKYTSRPSSPLRFSSPSHFCHISGKIRRWRVGLSLLMGPRATKSCDC